MLLRKNCYQGQKSMRKFQALKILLIFVGLAAKTGYQGKIYRK